MCDVDRVTESEDKEEKQRKREEEIIAKRGIRENK